MSSWLNDLPADVLPAIHNVEGGRVGLVVENSNGTADLGVMQINTVWIEPLARELKVKPAAVRELLANDACFNAITAGLVLRVYLAETHGDMSKAISYYNSHTPLIGLSYLYKVVNGATRDALAGKAKP